MTKRETKTTGHKLGWAQVAVLEEHRRHNNSRGWTLGKGPAYDVQVERSLVRRGLLVEVVSGVFVAVAGPVERSVPRWVG